ncbi:MAG TPA: AAA family ATPase [Micromonosporaceae bacterium]|nr:AAA family ATPase [Micromonosporaceae bacterium]
MVQPVTRPPPDTWSAAIHRSADDQEPLGAGVVIDEDRVLTSLHVLYSEGRLRDEVWVAFPRAGLPSSVRRRAEPVPLGPGRGLDLALLRLTTPAPPQATPARLRCVEAAALVGTGWWAFGFPRGDHLGDEARGTVSQALAYEHIQLSAAAPYRVEAGFSGAGVWCPEYAAVVGLVVMAKQAGEQRGHGRALTLYQADVDYPELKLQLAAEWSAEAAGDEALAAWGWTLRADPEEGRHWSPRARGVSTDSDRGYRFRGRTAALTEIVRWLDRPGADSRILVVTGSPGVGKSAVLGRVVTTADEKIRRALPADDGVCATVRSVACAVHVKGKTALDVAQEVARAASVALPGQPEDLVPALRRRLAERAARFNLVVDALDEAASPAQARLLLRAVLLPLARSCASLGFQAVVGTRRADNEGDLLAAFGGDAVVVDLDDSRYFSEPDLVAYVMATLQLVGAERVDNPYTDRAVAMPVAQRIAALAERNFLVAGLVARVHGLHDVEPVPVESLSFTATVDAAVDSYLARLFQAGQAPARMALTVLAFAEEPGLPLPLWRAGIIALGCNVTEEQLARFARSSAGNFLVETGADPARRAYRLFHQALNEALRRGRGAVAAPDADERRLVEAWLHHGKVTGWAGVGDYLLRWLPAHAQRAGAVDDILAEDGYLLHADLRRLVPVSDEAASDTGRARARLLQRTPLAVSADPPQRAAMFSAAETLDHIDSRFTALAGAPYRGLWARTPRGLERTVLEGHADAVLGVCPVPVGERSLLASAGQDGTVRLWDPATGQTERVLVGHAGGVRSVCAVPVGEDTLVASCGEDGTVRLWDPGADGATLVLSKHTDWVRAVCAVPVDGRDLVASCGDDRTVRLWDPVTGQLVRVLVGHTSWVTAVCPVPLEPGGHALLASGGYDGKIRLWDPTTGHLVRTLHGHAGWVTALCAVPVQPGGHGALLASAGYDGTVRIWDVTTGQPQQVLAEHARPVHGVAAVLTGARALLASAGEDGDVRVWDPATGSVERVLSGHTGWVCGICTVLTGGRRLLASASDDSTVRLWSPETRRPEGGIDNGRIGRIPGLCTMASADGDVLISTGDDGSVRLWDPTSGATKQTLTGHGRRVTAVCPVSVKDRILLASASEDRTVQLWDVDSGQTERAFVDHGAGVTAIVLLHVEGRRLLASSDDECTVRLWDPSNGRSEWAFYHSDWVTALCAVPVEGGHWLASAAVGGTVRLWDPASGQAVWGRQGHPKTVTAVSAVAVDGRHLVASASDDHTIRLWDPASGAPVATLFGHTAPVTGLCAVPRDGRELLASTSADRTVRLWDPGTGAVVQVIPVHHRALACWYWHGTLVIGLDTGVLAVELR